MNESRQKLRKDEPPRGWVVRLGSYLRIFGKPAPGTMGWKTAPEYIDGLIRTAKEREEEFADVFVSDDPTRGLDDR